MIEATELAWQAGIIDGEGTVTLSRQIRKGRPSPAFRPMVTVTNTNPDIVMPFVEMWGGAMYKRPDKRKAKKWADSWTWYCPRSSVIEFLKSIRPHLRAKHKQADYLIDFMLHCKSFPRSKGSAMGGKRGGSKPLGIEEIFYRESVWNGVRMLNAKGQFSRKGGIPNAPINRLN